MDIVLFLLILILSYFIIGVIASRNLRIRSFVISGYSTQNIKGFKIVLLSDLHGRMIGDNNKKLVDAILLQKPDVVIMAGDMVDAYDDNAKSAVALGKQLANKVKVITVRGNHFYKACQEAQIHMEEAFDAFGIKTLKNQRTIIQYKESKICIDGIDDPMASKNYQDDKKKVKLKRNRAVVKNALSKMQDDKVDCDYRLLVCHRPTEVDLFEKAGYDLVLSGHTHGGQWALPFGIEVLGDEAQFFPKKNMQSGLHYHKKMPLIITSGIGYSNVKLRTFMPPEIVAITFK